MKKAKGLLFGIIVLAMLFCSSRINHASAADDTPMTKYEFLKIMAAAEGKFEKYQPYFKEPGFSDLYYKWFLDARGVNGDENLKLDDSFPWASVTDEEWYYIVKVEKLVHYGIPLPNFLERTERYNRENGVYDEWERQQNISATRKMWSQSKLTGDSNSHGILTNKKDEIYQREENGGTKSGTDIGVGSYNMDEPSGASKVIMEFLCWLIYTLAKQLDDILSTGGIALDNVIFGRVAGYGVRTSPDSEYITLFGFELSNGNPYGYIGAMLFQRIRSYIYIFMSVFCLIKMVKIAASTDYMKMKMDFSTFAQNALISFSFIVMMPYIFDIYMYIRDVLLKAITFGTLKELFNTTGFLQSFREGAQSASLDIIPNIIYLGAVILSLVVAGIYVAYAMSMMVHFVLFPFVCLRGISDRNAYKEWAAEALGLTIMPLIDGMLLLIPLTFSDMANGNIAFNILSLVSCGMLLTARKQARRTIGIKDTGLDMGAIATVMGLGAMAKGIGKTVGKTLGKVKNGLGDAKDTYSAAKEDRNMAKMYDEEPGGGRVEAPEGENGFSAGPVGRLSASNLARHANVNNFDKGPFKDGLDNATMAQMYRKRSQKGYYSAVKKSFGAAGSGVGSLAGGLAGATVGVGVGAFAGGGAQTSLAGTGMDLGSSVGLEVGEMAGKAVPFGVSALGYIPVKRAEKFAGQVNGYNGAKIAGVAASVNNPFDDLGEQQEVKLLPAGVSSNLPSTVSSDAGAQTVAGGSAEVEVSVDGSGSRKENVAEFGKMHRGKYKICVATAAAKMDAPTLMNNSEFIGYTNNVQEQMQKLFEKARSGNYTEEDLLNSKDELSLSSIQNNFNAQKRQFLKDMSIKAGAGLGKEVFDMDNEVSRDLLDDELSKWTDGKNSPLAGDGKFMSEQFDKQFKLDWAEWRQYIERECRNSRETN